MNSRTIQYGSDMDFSGLPESDIDLANKKTSGALNGAMSLLRSERRQVAASETISSRRLGYHRIEFLQQGQAAC